MAPNTGSVVTITTTIAPITPAPLENLDVAFLAAGWHASGEALTVEDGMHLIEVARMLTRVYDELCIPEEYPGVFVYEISEELGKYLGANQEHDIGVAERLARRWIAAQMDHARKFQQQ